MLSPFCRWRAETGVLKGSVLSEGYSHNMLESGFGSSQLALKVGWFHAACPSSRQGYAIVIVKLHP